MNILVVDDHPENVMALEAVLESPDYNVMTATSGEQALKYVLQDDFAVILLDVQMSGLNGFETAKLIKSREKSRDIPIVFITALNHTPEYIMEGYSIGAIDYIVKPYHPDALRLKVTQLIELYKNYEQKREKSKLLGLRTRELKQVNRKLDRVTLDLRKMQALMRAINETALDSIVTFDQYGYIITANRAVQTMFGCLPDSLIGEHIAGLFCDKMFTEHMETLDSNTRSINFLVGKITEATARHDSGREFPVDIQVHQAHVDNDIFYVCSIRDISERKQLELTRKRQYDVLEKLVKERTIEILATNKKLQQEIEERKKIAETLQFSQELFQRIFDVSPSMMAIIALFDQRYIDVNESWLRGTGYSRSEIFTRRAHHLKISILAGHMVQELSDIGEGITHNVRIRYETRNGQIREGLLSVENIEIHKEKCQLRVITDITERVYFENKMARFDRLNLIGEMAAGIAHEIRNPMTTVRGFLQMTKKRGKLMPPHIDLMIEELDRANAIITEYLSLAKDKSADRQEQDLNQIIESLSPLIQAEALRSDKTVLVKLGECPDLWVDEKEVRQLVLNLALNGLEAMQAGGQLTLRTYTDADAVVLEVRDTGKGIPPELLEKIGTPFFTTKDQGTGLGLAVCYSVAARHDAVIEVDTCETGTAFIVRFHCDDE